LKRKKLFQKIQIEIVSKAEKLSFLRSVHNVAGIYALLKDGHVFYVGISKRIGHRIHNHLNKYGFDCDFMLLEEIELTDKYRLLSKTHYKRERYWIFEFVRFGIVLKNDIKRLKQLS